MRVLVDATALTDGSGDRGVGTYLKNLLRGLGAREDLQVSALCARGATLPAGVTPVPVRRIRHHRVGPFVEDRLLTRDLRKRDANLHHSPAFSPPSRSPMPVVQTLHDLTPLVFEHPLLARDAVNWRRKADRFRRAAAVIAVSRSSAQQGIDLFGLDPSRITVVPHGVDARFRPGDGPDLPPYLLAVSSWGPHKGFRELAAAFDRVVDAGSEQRLRVVGFQDAWMRARLEEDLARARHRERIDLVGWAPDLVAEYRGATALLVTSRAEGFGLPAAEAMACGTPVVAFDNTSLPEVVGTGGLLVPDGDVIAFAEAVVGLLPGSSLRQELAAAAVREARRFDWEASLAQHVEVYRSVAAGANRPPHAG